MLCDSVGITPVPNNGTLHLPLQPLGVHGPDDFEEPVYDPTPLGGEEAAAEGPGKPIGVDPVSVVPDIGMAPDGGSPTAIPTGAEDAAENDDDDEWIDEAESKIKGFWDWLKEKVGGVWGQAGGSA